jgi:hypothetical protein
MSCYGAFRYALGFPWDGTDSCVQQPPSNNNGLLDILANINATRFLQGNSAPPESPLDQQ